MPHGNSRCAYENNFKFVRTVDLEKNALTKQIALHQRTYFHPTIQYQHHYHSLLDRSETTEHKDFIYYMELILDGHSEIGTHVRSNLCNLICLRHLISSRAITNFFFLDILYLRVFLFLINPFKKK